MELETPLNARNEAPASPSKVASANCVDSGTAYGRQVKAYDPRLTEVGSGTPMGELLRRYWHPIAVSSELGDLPHRVRLLGENLVVFRDKQGCAGLVVEQCCHRGASLFYGRVEEDGIRCAYHGWKFDTQGRCIDMACEKAGGKRTSAHRQPWYPVEERYGVIWAYMGPPERKPILPRWQAFEDLEGGETLGYIYPAFGYGPPEALDYNWLQSYENTLDVMHAIWLHIAHSEENQFGFEPAWTPEFDPHSFIEHTSWSDTESGVRYEQVFPMSGGNGYHYSVEAIMPNINVIPTPKGGKLSKMQWHVPIDDTHFRIFVINRCETQEVAANLEVLKHRGGLHKGKEWREMSDEEHQRWPGDYETQSTQGKIAIHAHEHLVQSDTGVVMLRRRLKGLIKDMESGLNPLGVTFDANEPARSSVAYAWVGPMQP